MLSLYISQPTWLHRLPPSLKLVGLAAASVALLPAQHLTVLIAATLFTSSGFLSLGKPGYRRLVDVLKTAGLLAAFIGFFQFLVVVREVGSLQAVVTATASSLRLLSLVLLADLISVTTPLSKMLKVIEGLLGLLTTLGVKSQRLSLVVGMMIRSASLLRQLFHTAGDAYRARRGKSAGIGIVAPVVRQAVSANLLLAEGLQSRALRRPPHQ